MALKQVLRRPRWPALDAGLSFAGLLALRLGFPEVWQLYLPYVFGILLPPVPDVLAGALWVLLGALALWRTAVPWARGEPLA